MESRELSELKAQKLCCGVGLVKAAQATPRFAFAFAEARVAGWVSEFC